MKRPRVSIASLMIAVVLVAVSAAVGRACLALEDNGKLLLFGVAVMGIAAQVAVVLMIRGRRSARFFWAGFLTFGLAALTSFGWATLDPGDEEIIHRDGTKEVISSISIHVFPDGRQEPIYPSRNLEFWDRYENTVLDPLERLPDSPWYAPRWTTVAMMLDALMICVVIPLALALPQLLFAAAGGLLTWRVARIAIGRSGAKPAEEDGANDPRDGRSANSGRLGSFAPEELGAISP